MDSDDSDEEEAEEEAEKGVIDQGDQSNDEEKHSLNVERKLTREVLPQNDEPCTSSTPILRHSISDLQT